MPRRAPDSGHGPRRAAAAAGAACLLSLGALSAAHAADDAATGQPSPTLDAGGYVTTTTPQPTQSAAPSPQPTTSSPEPTADPETPAPTAEEEAPSAAPTTEPSTPPASTDPGGEVTPSTTPSDPVSPSAPESSPQPSLEPAPSEPAPEPSQPTSEPTDPAQPTPEPTLPVYPADPADPADPAIPEQPQPSDGAEPPNDAQPQATLDTVDPNSPAGQQPADSFASPAGPTTTPSAQPTWQSGTLPGGTDDGAPYAAPGPSDPAAEGQQDSSLDLSGVSSWVGHYLQTEREGTPVSPVDSNANAGVSDVDGREGQVTGEGTMDEASGYLSALRGPVPVAIFSLVAIGGLAAILARSSRSIANRRREPAE